MQEQQGSQQERYLARKALKSALSHLKADHAGDFLSCHGQRVFETFVESTLLYNQHLSLTTQLRYHHWQNHIGVCP
uniref:Uncharacterized protein n=1 Tax=Zea mays TaxID=4577 RepID=A0A804U8G9_MAIZE